MTLSLPDVLLGSPPPRVRSAPVVSSSAGQEAVELAASAGLHLDPAQQLVLRDALGERSGGRWAAFEVGVVEARQNGKGGIIEARELAGLFLLGEMLIMHTAHLFDTALEAFRRILFLIESTPDLDSRVLRVSKSHGEEGIELKTGQRLRFKARTKGGGRGFTGDCTILDEAMILPQSAISALMPTMSARPNPQLWYLGSAVDRDEHPDGKVFSEVRHRGLRGDDPSLVWVEWSAPPLRSPKRPDGADPDDPSLWAATNPGVAAGRISLEHIAKERRSMTDRAFRVERLSADDYWWPPESELLGDAFDLDRWASLMAPTSRPVAPCFGVAVALDRSWTAIAAAWRAPSGRVRVEVVANDRGTDWVADRVARLQSEHGRGTVAASQTARGLVPGADERNLGALADNALADLVAAGALEHAGQPELTTSIRAARWKPSGDSRVLDRKGTTDISPLTAAALAVHALTSEPPRGGWMVGL